MSQKDFDRIDVTTSVVAQHIYHASLPEYVRMLMCLRLAPMVGFVQDEYTQNVPTILTHVYELADAKREMRRALEGDIVKHPVYRAAVKAMEKEGALDAQNFKEVVSSKLFELLMAHHTGIVTEKLVAIAKSIDEVNMSVGVAFALEREDEKENQQYH